MRRGGSERVEFPLVVAAGLMISSQGRATAAPAPRNTVLREILFDMVRSPLNQTITIFTATLLPLGLPVSEAEAGLRKLLCPPGYSGTERSKPLREAACALCNCLFATTPRVSIPCSCRHP